MAVRRASLKVLLKRVKVEAITSLAQRSKMYSKDWIRALNMDLERLGVLDKEKRLQDPKPLNHHQEKDQSVQRMVGSRPQVVDCEFGNCNRKFDERKEKQSHLRNYNDALDQPELNTLNIAHSNVDVPQDLNGSGKGCEKQYKTLRRLKAHIKTARPQCTLNGEEQSDTVE